MGVVVTHTTLSIDSTILFQPPTGDVWEWFNDVSWEFGELARDLAPPRRSSARHGTWATGRMQAGIRATAPVAIGAKTLEVNCSSSAPYSIYVLRGTARQGTRWIYTSHGWKNKGEVNRWLKEGGEFLQFEKGYKGFAMPVSRIPFAKGPIVLRVRGQRPNPFLQDAYRILSHRHAALPRMDFDRAGDFAEPSPPIAPWPR